MKKITTICLSAILFMAYSCGNSNDKQANNNADITKASKTSKADSKQLNISILLDLSNRIDPQAHPATPEHAVRDSAIIEDITTIFKQEMEKQGAFKANGKIKIFFTPQPDDPQINIIANKLRADCSLMDNQQKKDLYDNITQVFSENLSAIYKQTISSNHWVGSDIWRFFKNDVKDYCVEQDTTYRNILIILTDGYIYHIQSKDQVGNRFAYLVPSNMNKYRNANWQELIQKDDFGLIAKRADLQNLEVLVLEVCASEKCLNDEDILKFLLEKWLKEMNVGKYAVYNTTHDFGLTNTRLKNFIN